MIGLNENVWRILCLRRFFIQWVDLMMRYVRSISYSIKFNGKP